MPGAAISRWTMSYFAAACLFLIVGEALMVAGYGYPQADLRAPATLIVVHVIAIGWLALLMAGALLQFVPVLVSVPLQIKRLALPALLLLVFGLLCLLAGFSGLGGLRLFVFGHEYGLPAGAAALIAGFSLIGAMLAATLSKASPLPLPARFVAAGLVCLGVTVLLGATFAFSLSGMLEATWAADLHREGLPVHVVLGLGGWMSFTAIGVSYRLVAMFLLAPESERKTSRLVWWLGTGGLALAAAALPLIVAEKAATDDLLVASFLLSAVAVALYGGDVRHLHATRKRKAVELNIRASFGAFAALILFLAAAAFCLISGSFRQHIGPLAYLLVFGWLSGLGLAQLYKIVPFLTWLECYGPVLGRVPTPRVQDIVRENRAAIWFYVYYGAVLFATIALFAGAVSGFRIAVSFQLVSTLALMAEFVRARWLSDVSVGQRLPAGAIRPNLFLPPFISGGHR